MRIAVLAHADSWYYRDIARAAADLHWDCMRIDFTRLVAGIQGSDERGKREEARDKRQETRNHLSEIISVPCPPSTSSGPLSLTLSPEAGERELVPGDLETISVSLPQPPGQHPHSPSAITLPPSPLSRAPCPLSTAHFPLADVLIVRTMPPGSLEQVIFRMNVLARCEAAGMKVVNSPKSLECAVDKYLTTSKCLAAGLPVPETVVCETEEDALAAFDLLGRDVVVKPLFGSEGRGILRVSDPDLALRTFRTLSRLQSVLYLQRFIPHPGFDVRVMVLAGEILGGMKRFAADGDFRTNVSRQARAEPYDPNEMERDLALRAAEATGAWFAGVDLLYDQSGRCYVVEVNAVPGWKAFGRVHDMDVAQVFLRKIAEEPGLRVRE